MQMKVLETSETVCIKFFSFPHSWSNTQCINMFCNLLSMRLYTCQHVTHSNVTAGILSSRYRHDQLVVITTSQLLPKVAHPRALVIQPRRARASDSRVSARMRPDITGSGAPLLRVQVKVVGESVIHNEETLSLSRAHDQRILVL